MDLITRRIAAGAVAVSLAGVSVAASAVQVDRGTGAQKVTSARIKDNTIQARDLTASLRGSIASALHGVPASSVGTDQVAANSLTAADLAPGSVGASEVADGTLSAADVASVRGVTDLNFPNMAPHSCYPLTIPTGNTLSADLLLVTPGPDMPYQVTITARQDKPSTPSEFSATMVIVACNVSDAPVDPPSVAISWAVIEN